MGRAIKISAEQPLFVRLEQTDVTWAVTGRLNYLEPQVLCNNFRPDRGDLDDFRRAKEKAAIPGEL